MKSVLIATLFAASVSAQAPQAPAPAQPAVPVTPGTPAVKAPAAPPSTSAPVLPDTVVLSVDGKKMTAAQVDALIASLPPQLQQAARAQPQVLGQIFLYQRLAADAEKEGLDKISPYKEAIELNRMQVLAQAELTSHQNNLSLTSDDQQKYYKDHQDKYRQAKVRVIYISFNPTPDKPAPGGKKLLTEAEAKAKIEDLRKQIVNGADFGKVARENSEDASSAAKDGDFGVIKHSSPYPEPVKNAVFALKTGEMSDPVRMPNGFYLIRLDDLSTESYDEVSNQISQDIRQDSFTEWLKPLQSQYSVKIENQSYFSPRVSPQLQQVR